MPAGSSGDLLVRTCTVSLRSRNAHGHLARARLCENLQWKSRTPDGAPWSNLYTYRKNPPVWTQCLGKKEIHMTNTNSKCSRQQWVSEDLDPEQQSLLEKNIWTSNPKQKKIVITTKHPQIIATHHDMSPISRIHHPLTICSYGGEHEKAGRMASTNYTLSSKHKKLSSPLDIVVYQNISYALI